MQSAPEQLAVLFDKFAHMMHMACAAEAGAFDALFEQKDSGKTAHALVPGQLHVLALVNLHLRQRHAPAAVVHDALQHW